jgi:hypothetical protein
METVIKNDVRNIFSLKQSAVMVRYILDRKRCCSERKESIFLRICTVFPAGLTLVTISSAYSARVAI